MSHFTRRGFIEFIILSEQKGLKVIPSFYKYRKG